MSESAGMVAVERLSGVDRAWLLMDRQSNPMINVGLILLSGTLDRERLLAVVAKRFLAFDRFRCYPVADTLGASWVPAPQFNIDDHVLTATLSGAAGQRELEALVGELASTPFPPERPLWTFHLIENCQGGSAIAIRIHHCYADGIALVQVLLSLADRARPGGRRRRRRTDTSSAPEGTHGMIPGVFLGALRGGIGLIDQGTGLLEQGIHYALHPAEATGLARDALGVAGELTHIGTMPDDPPSCLKRPLSGNRRVAWAEPLSLEEVRTIGHVLGCTINDVLVSTLAGALRSYLEAQGDEVSGVTLRATVPVDLRSGDGSDPVLGNRFGLVFIDLPVGIRHPLERLYAVHASMQSLKGSKQALATLSLLSFVGSLPAPVEEPATALFSAKASLVASNVPGPREPLSLAGVPVSRVLFWVPQAGSIGTGVSMLSYNGQVQFGVIADEQLIPEPAQLVKRIATEFDRLVFLVLLGGAALSP
jgi:diacylglycerol O-acyltransferase / wax synthase